jgi:hypothetical protein
LPQEASHKHFLLFTPFRYAPKKDSRFRRAGQKGIWYGAADIYTALCEIAYWRRMFVTHNAANCKAVAAGNIITTDHTVFNAQVRGLALDLSTAPWATWRVQWRASSYAETHALADAVIAASAQWIRYESARVEPTNGVGKLCAAVLMLDALSEITNKPIQSTTENWRCMVKHGSVVFVRDVLGERQTHVFSE